ncbi:MAG: asparagine synthase (glutamine-hydrolyzing) [bacterium]|nr:asparagine synthase (glutamine-hydrolyzing) [bacterium]
MCGIAGIYQNKKIYNKKDLEAAAGKMNTSQKNRGPDDEGVFVDVKNGVALGHSRLSIIDLSKSGHQPMIWQNGSILRTSDVPNIGGNFRTSDVQTLVITYSGEIYNFLELKKDLEKKGYKFKTKTDTEVILALYAECGEKSFEMLRGMFAFGLWDGKNQKLFLVKDRYGIKPLYYYSDNEKLIFASTVKALENSGIILVQKNPDAYIGFLLFGSVPLPTTTIKNVYAVPAGHYLVREADGSQKLIQYYEPLEFFKNKTQNFQDNTITRDSIRSLLEESVNLHLISDAPLGVFLSGGLDSSVIAALAAQTIKNQRLKTLSIIFDEPEFSEEYYSDLVAKKIGSDHRKIKITKQDFYDSFEEIFEAMDQPTIDGVNTFFIAKAAKQAGLKTVLSGLGADEIFLGYPHFRRAELLRKIQNLPKFLKSPLKLGSLFGDKYSKLSYFTNDDILSFYLGIRGLFTPQETAKILDTNVQEVNNFIDKLSHQLQHLEQLHPIGLLSYLELKFYLQNQLLKDTDFMSMRHSVEVRVPFLDHPLVEYLSSLPANLKLKNLKTKELKNINKPLLVAAVRDLLPQEIFTRPKMGFTFPFQNWLREIQDTKYQIQNTKSHWSRSWAKAVLNKF